jgi:hypothetical protein
VSLVPGNYCSNGLYLIAVVILSHGWILQPSDCKKHLYYLLRDKKNLFSYIILRIFI